METKTIGKSALALIIASLLFLGGVAIDDPDAYTCEDTGIIMNCDKLSVYYELDNGKCWNSVVGNKLCRTGWLHIIDDSVQLKYTVDVDADKEQWLESIATKKNTTTEQEVQSIIDNTIAGDIKQKLQQEFFAEWTRIVQEDKVAEAVEALKLI